LILFACLSENLWKRAPIYFCLVGFICIIQQNEQVLACLDSEKCNIFRGFCFSYRYLVRMMLLCNWSKQYILDLRSNGLMRLDYFESKTWLAVVFGESWTHLVFCSSDELPILNRRWLAWFYNHLSKSYTCPAQSSQSLSIFLDEIVCLTHGHEAEQINYFNVRHYSFKYSR